MRWVLCLGLLALGCGSEPDKIIYAGSDWYGHAPVWVGIRKGIFEKHGFSVEKRAFGGSSFRVNALEAGNAHFASLGEAAMLTAMAQDRRGFYWIGSQNIAPGNEGLVGIGIDSIKDLKGKKIALFKNTSIHLTVALLLKEAGLDIRKDVTVLNGADSAVVQLVRNGEARAGAIWEPFFTDLRNLEGAKVLATDMDTSLFRRFKTMSGPDVVCAAKKWVDADPDRARRFFQAYFEAVQWCQDHPDELVRIVMEVVRQPEEDVRATLKNFQWIGWAGQKEMMSDARMFGQAEVVSDLLIELGLMDKTPAFKEWTRIDWFWE